MDKLLSWEFRRFRFSEGRRIGFDPGLWTLSETSDFLNAMLMGNEL